MAKSELGLKFYKAKLKTGGKTIEDIKKDYEGGIGPVPDEQEIKDLKKAYDLIDGVEVMAIEGFGDGYGIGGWNPKHDDQMKEFIYQAEQDSFFGTYRNKREEFEQDWKNDEYESSGSLRFDNEEVEILAPVEMKQLK